MQTTKSSTDKSQTSAVQTDISQITIWRFIDGKIGHEKQSQALLMALQEFRDIHCIDIPIQHSQFFYLIHCLFKLSIKSHSNYQSPQLIIGAGHKTHLAILAVQRFYNCKSVVMMKPSLPHKLFTVVTAPRHDYFNKTIPNNVVVTPTAITPATESHPNNKLGLILLGGKSNHYHWDEDKILATIEMLLENNQDNIVWKLTNSRRTPESTLSLIKKNYSNNTNLEIYEHQNLSSNWLAENLTTAGHIYVTADSVSMISESLMTAASVKLIELKPKNRNGKIVKANQYLAEEGYLTVDDKLPFINRKIIDNEQTSKKILDLLEL